MVVVEEQKAQNASAGAQLPTEPPPRQLSAARVLILFIVIAGVAFGVWKLVTGNNAAAADRSHATPVYAPYVDVTLTPTYPFQLPSANPVAGAYLGFIVSDPKSACTPSWGGYYTLSQAAQTLDLDARVAQLRSQGGTAMVSFGGQANTELAVDCTNQAQLAAAYMAPIQRYHSTTIDLDIEGNNLSDAAANGRRATAIATVQKRLQAEHKQLHVWVTLPVSDQGLTSQGEAAVRALLAAHVKLAGVNAMAMDFGPGEGAAKNLFKTVERSLYATHGQVQSLFSTDGRVTPGFAWAHLGATVMLGVNDVTDERFTIADARKLTRFANHFGLPRVSIWSLNRDSECGAAFAQVGVVSNTCSGVRQSPLEFTHIFSRLRGTTTARTEESSGSAPTQSSSIENQASSPYPIWQSSAAYVTDYKVVWNGQIYQANYWSQGTPPDSTTSSTTSPWQLIGPVPAGSHAPKPILLNKGFHLTWSPTTVYRQGDIVEFDGLPFEARYYTHGNQPLKALPANPSSPWQPLFTYPGEPGDSGIGSGSN